nr:immunoglobulin heavy chain junction region [Macaca mulatta]MOY21154.1 immunoglobulin heavy chain junction region [Macaca mulatta]MOY21195.1 immunoglobulin heavy chain junction region [Macaca mulatta]MOY21215.1 immunoglobulin heavy chain junction region [Macaca mulatta]MOY21465.1 immunoglobulin heavy chain junction region [Macaca mulatta]
CARGEGDGLHSW